MTIALCGMKFFFERTLGRGWAIFGLIRPPREAKLPVVLSREEIARVLGQVRIPVYRACLTTIYACGLRLMEGARLHAGIPRKVWRHRWVVHGQHAGSGERVLDYLGRYLYRVAIANSRIESFDDGLVTFRYRDNRSSNIRRCTLPAERFLAQFLQHVLPRGFSKVRSFGLYSPTAMPALAQARSLLQAAVPENDVPTRSDPSFPSENPSEDPPCPRCRQGHLRLVAILVRLLETEPAAPSRAPL